MSDAPQTRAEIIKRYCTSYEWYPPEDSRDWMAFTEFCDGIKELMLLHAVLNPANHPQFGGDHQSRPKIATLSRIRDRTRREISEAAYMVKQQLAVKTTPPRAKAEPENPCIYCANGKVYDYVAVPIKENAVGATLKMIGACGACKKGHLVPRQEMLAIMDHWDNQIPAIQIAGEIMLRLFAGSMLGGERRLVFKSDDDVGEHLKSALLDLRKKGEVAPARRMLPAVVQDALLSNVSEDNRPSAKPKPTELGGKDEIPF